MILAKICVLGEVSVGKTSLIRRFVDRSFSDAYLTTVGVKISRKLVRLEPDPSGIAADTDLQLVIWDLEGGHNSIDLSSTYLKGARGAIVVGDLTRSSTLDQLQEHIDRFRYVNPQGRVVIALNKSDLQTGAAGAIVDRWNDVAGVAKTICTSAKTGKGVDELFTALGMSILQDTGNAAEH
ncbi:MAG: small GTP-binding protein domain protein [Bacteroidetes bacterium]|jgi:small GTP-binding protein|nr:small GTP-binding protein domain protein [Bacteroidota bacterium]